MKDNTTSELLKSLESNYLQGNYKDMMQSLLDNKESFDKGIFHYNLGTLHAKMGNLGAARYNLEMSIKEGMAGPRSYSNLIAIKKRIGVDDISTSTYVKDKLIDLSTSIPKAGHFSISLSLILLILIFFKLKFIKNIKVLVVLLMVSTTPIIIQQTVLRKLTVAISLKEVDVYEGPSEIYSVKTQLKAGSKIVLGKYSDGWYFIKYPLFLTGWVKKDSMANL